MSDHGPAAPPPLATSRSVTTVFDEILAAVHRGELQPGQHISDGELALQYGVSRTPIREALQRLREIGIIEASPSRFTRIAIVTPKQTADAFVVWIALYRVLLEEVIPRGVTDAVPELEEHHAAYVEAMRVLDTDAIATINLFFFSILPHRSTNESLQRGIISVVHLIRLGSLHLPDYIDFAALNRSHELLIEAARTSSIETAREAMNVIGTIDVPQV